MRDLHTHSSSCCPLKVLEPLCESSVLSVRAEPYILIMEYVSYGTLRTFLRTHRVPLSADPELQSLLTIASYHIALAMQHLRSKMVKTRQLVSFDLMKKFHTLLFVHIKMRFS